MVSILSWYRDLKLSFALESASSLMLYVSSVSRQPHRSQGLQNSSHMIYCLCRNFKSLWVFPSMMELSCLHIGLEWRMCASISDWRILLKLQISVSSEAPMTRDFYSFSSKTLFSSSFEFPKTLIAKEISLPSVSQQQWAPIAVSSQVPCLACPSLM